MTSPEGTDRAQRSSSSSEKLTMLTATGRRGGARISREKETILLLLTSPAPAPQPQLRAHGPPTEKSARKAAPRRRRHPDSGRPSSVGGCCCVVVVATRSAAAGCGPTPATTEGSSAPLSGRSVGRVQSFIWLFFHLPSFLFQFNSQKKEKKI